MSYGCPGITFYSANGLREATHPIMHFGRDGDADCRGSNWEMLMGMSKQGRDELLGMAVAPSEMPAERVFEPIRLPSTAAGANKPVDADNAGTT